MREAKIKAEREAEEAAANARAPLSRANTILRLKAELAAMEEAKEAA